VSNIYAAPPTDSPPPVREAVSICLWISLTGSSIRRSILAGRLSFQVSWSLLTLPYLVLRGLEAPAPSCIVGDLDLLKPGALKGFVRS